MATHDKWDLRFLNMAALVASWSKDPSTKVGAVIVDSKKRIVSLGYNGFARGQSDAPKFYENRDYKYPRVIHAELNAIFNANKSVEGCTVYTTFFPCPQCAAALIQNGIKRVITMTNLSDERYKDQFLMSKQMFDSAYVAVQVLDLQPLEIPN